MSSEYEDIATDIFPQTQRGVEPAMDEGIEPQEVEAPDDDKEDKAPTYSDDYELIAKEIEGPDTTRLKSSAFLAGKKDPEKHAKALKYSREFGVPAFFAEKHLESFEKKKESNNSLDYESLIETSPRLAKWLEDPSNAVVSKGDTDKLQKIEKDLVKIRLSDDDDYKPFEALALSGNQLAAGAGQLGLLYGLVPEGASDDVFNAIAERNKRSQELSETKPRFAKELDKIIQKESADVARNWDLFLSTKEKYEKQGIIEALSAFGEGGSMTVAETVDLIYETMSRPKAMSRMALESFSYSIPSLAGGGLGAVAGAKGGAAVGTLIFPGAGTAAGALLGGAAGGAIGLFSGSSATEIGIWFNNSLIERGYDITNAEDLKRAYSNKKLFAELKGEAERKGLTTAAVDAAFAGFAGKFLSKAGKGLRSKAVAATKDVSLQMAGETASEAAGQLAAFEGDFKRINVGESIIEGLTSFFHSGAETAIGTGARYYLEGRDVVQAAKDLSSDAIEAQTAVSEVQSISSAMEAVIESNTAQRDSESFASFIDNVTDGNQKEIFFQKDEFENYWREQGESPVQKAEELLGVDAATYNSIENNIIETQFSEVLKKLGDKEKAQERKAQYDDLKNIIRTRPDAMSLQEADSFIKELPKTVEEMAKEAKIEKERLDQIEAEGKIVRAEIEAQLEKADLDKKQAVLHENFFKAMATRTGEGVNDLYKKYGLTVERRKAAPQDGGDILFQDDSKAGETQTETKPPSISDAVDNVGTFDPESDNIYMQKEGGQPQGYITKGYNDFFNKIVLLEKANKSTFLHESGHYFLEVMRDISAQDNSPQEIKEDMQTLLGWFGVESADQITTEQHEMFARGFEKYLATNKAPSKSLKKIFNTFKVWLLDVYKDLRALNVNLTDDVRDVMNRMLAADYQVETAKQEIGDAPLFVDPIKAGMTKAMSNKYSRLQSEAREKAEEKIRKKLMKERERVLKERTKDYEQKIRKEAEEERVYKAIFNLKKGKMPDGGDLPKGVGAIKISKKEVERRFPQFSENENFKGTFNEQKALPLDIAASLLNYPDVQTMMVEIANATPFEEYIKNQSMITARENSGDLLNSEVLNMEATIAYHNESREKRLRMEYEHLATNAKGLSREIIRRVTRRPAPSSQMKQLAEEQINNLQVGNIRPHMFKQQERKFAKEAGKAVAKGDIEKAFLMKEKELLAHYLYKNASEAKITVDKKKKDIKKFFKKDEKLAKTRDLNYIQTARAILSRYGIGNSSLDPIEHIESIKKYDPESYEAMASLVKNIVKDPKNYKDLTMGQFEELMDSVQALWDLSRDSKTIEIDGKKIEIEKVVSELSSRLEPRIRNRKIESIERTINEEEKKNIKLLGAVATARRFENLVDSLDIDYDGPFRKYLWDPVSKASDNFIEINAKYKKKIVDLSAPVKERIDLSKPIDASELINQETKKSFQFQNKAELLGAMLHVGNSSNKKKLLIGRGWGYLDEAGNLVSKSWDDFIARMHREGVITKEDWDYVQALWDMMEEIKPDAQKAHKKVFGFYFNEITSEPVQTPFGEYRGGYAPAKVDPYAVKDIAKKEELEQFMKGHQSFNWPAAGGKGFTISRQENFNKPLSMDLNLVVRHMEDALRFTYVKPAVVDVAKVLINSEFENIMDLVNPKVIDNVMKPALNRADKNTIYLADPGRSEIVTAFKRWTDSGAKAQIMFANMVNTLEQAAGTVVAATKISPKYIAKSAVRYMFRHKEIGQSVVEKSQAMRTRNDDQIYEIGRRSREIFSEKSNYQKMKDFIAKHAYVTQAAFQNVLDAIVWQASYDESIANGLSDAKAVLKADSDVRLTQTSRRPIDISSIESNETFVLFNAFMSFFNSMANLNLSNFQQLYYQEMGLKQKAGKALYLYVAGFASLAWISALIRAGAAGTLDEDQDDEVVDDLFDIFVMSQFRLGAAMVPAVGPAINASLNAYNDVYYDDRVSASPALTATAAVGKTAVRFASGKLFDDKGQKGEVRDALTALGLVSGLPLGAAARPVSYIMDVEEGKARPTGPIDFTRGLVTGKPGSD